MDVVQHADANPKDLEQVSGTTYCVMYRVVHPMNPKQITGLTVVAVRATYSWV